jgi:hypothetical protein
MVVKQWLKEQDTDFYGEEIENIILHQQMSVSKGTMQKDSS